MPGIFIPALKKTLVCPPGARLLDVLADAGIPIESPCGGRGTCGKCGIRVLTDAGTEARLACCLRPERDLTVEIPRAERGHRFLATGVAPDFEFVPAETEAYGLAVDIGTTTVVVSLIDFRDGRETGTRSTLNPQKEQGLDVLTRIACVRRHGAEGLRLLQSRIADALGEMGRSLCAENGVDPRSVREIAASANTTMLHLLLGVDPSPMGIAPFAPSFVDSRTVRASSLGLPFEEADLFTLPSVSAFVGADVVAGVWACGAAKGHALFVDIGTNGEIVLSRDGRLTACSCAAGPALEGMNIRCGMRAAEGAIEDVSLLPDGALRLSVVGDAAPVGLCGSGLLAALRELLRVGLVRSDGCMLKASDLPPDSPLRALCRTEDGQAAVQLAPSVVLTQKDVRQVQLAKGALLSGIRTLLNRSPSGDGAPDRVFVAGQFGAHLPVSSLTDCGLLPELPAERVKYVGNTSLSGARAALLSPPARREMDALARSIEYVELAGSEDYERLFLECLEFPARGA